MKKIGIIGAGTMGVDIAVDLILHHIEFVLIDVTEEILEKAKEQITKYVRFIPLMNSEIQAVHATEINRCLHASTQIDNVGCCDFIIENVTEQLTVKQGVYEALDRICPPTVCIGANTSCISVTELGAFTDRADKIVGMHLMNPVYLKPMAEVIRGWHTSDESIAIAKEFLGILNKEAIVVNDYPGFVSNRISHLFMNEAAYVVQDGVATADQVDSIFCKCFGHKMGPLQTADFIGLDTVVDSLNILYQSYQDSKFRCCPLLKKMVAAGLLGKKSGKGFYQY